MIRAGNLDEARLLYRDRLDPLYYEYGAYQLIIELMLAFFVDGDNNPPLLKEEQAQAWVLNELANAYSLSGQPRRAVPLFLASNEPDEKSGNKKGVAIGLGNVAYMAQIYIGALKDAGYNLKRSIELSIEVKSEVDEAIGHQELGRVLSYCGEWQNALQELAVSTVYWNKTNRDQGACIDEAYRSLYFLLIARTNPQSKQENIKSSIASATHALELAEEGYKTGRPNVVDVVRASWLLGAAFRETGELNKSDESLVKAINICRQINMVYFEADILLDLARLRYDQKKPEESKSLADEALTITERCGYVLQGADVNLFLAQYALEQEHDETKAKEYAETALKLATCDGPPYYYKVAYEEAKRMLEMI
jgi:tetratricopeptide (TPR) repeat protein